VRQFPRRRLRVRGTGEAGSGRAQSFVTPALTSAAPIPSHRLHLLEGLRGYMAWWVVAFHFLGESGFSSAWLPSVGKMLAQGGYAVDVFIILSGFVITHLLTTQKTSYLDFIRRRFFRLYPLFLLCVLVGFIAFGATSSVYEAFREKMHGAPQPVAMWASHREHLGAHLLVSLTMFHGAVPNAWLPYAQSAFDPPGWSISLEWQFYLVLPLVLWGVWRRPGFTLAVILAVMAFRHRYNIGDWGSFLPQRAEFFAVGILSYYLFRSLTRIQNEAGKSVAWSKWVFVLLVLLLTPLRDLVVRPYDVQLGDWLPLALWAFVLALLVETHAPNPSRFARRAAKIFLNPLAQFLGRVSYSTYLLHYFAIYAVMALCVASGLALNKYVSLAAMTLIATPLTIAASALSYRFIEKPGMELGKRWSAPKKKAVSSDDIGVGTLKTS
jgi:peptidoglycan/LPS O-acetylase OafA/YrhL